MESTQEQGQKRRWLSRRALLTITILLAALVIIIVWILSSLGIIPTPLASALSAIVSVAGVVVAILPSNKAEPATPPAQASVQVPAPPATTSQLPPIVQLPTTSALPSKTPYRGIVGIPPSTDPKTIEQRENIVTYVYRKLTQPDTAAIVLTGIGGVGKSTLAALIYRYAEEQRQAGNGPFTAEALWLRVDPAATMADLIGTVFETLGKPVPDFGSLSPHNQAAALCNALNAPDQARLVVLDQFENLLDWQTGHALPDRSGVGEWLDAINSQPCSSRLLLTSRPLPRGTQKHALIYLQECPIKGLEVAEGIELLRKQGIEGSELELRTAVERCDGHAYALRLLAFIVHEHQVSLSSLFNDPIYTQLWTGDIALNLLDQIYTQQLSEIERKVLLAFSAYREPVPLDAVQALIDFTPIAPKTQMVPAVNALRTENLLQVSSGGRYQLHTIVASYAMEHFVEGDEQTNQQALQTVHLRAAQYYIHHTATEHRSHGQRRQRSDVHHLIEAVWQYCQAEHWQAAYDLMQQEGIFADLHRWGSNAILLELYQLLLPSDKWQPEPLQAANIYNNLGWVTSELGQQERARSYFEKALALCRQLGDRAEEGSTLNNLAWVYSELGQKKQSQEYLEQALTILREVGDRAEESRTLNNLGKLYDSLGQKEQARVHHEQALVICKEIGDRAGVGWTLNNLGKVYDDIEQKEQALAYLEEALSIRKEVGNLLAEGRTLKNLGSVYRTLGRQEEALKCLTEALEIAREVGDRGGEGMTLTNLGKVYEIMKQRDQALKCYEEALGILREVGDRRREGWVLNVLGRVYSKQGEVEQGEKYYHEAVRAIREAGDRWEEGKALHNIGSLYYFERHQYDVALAFLLSAIKIFEEIQSPRRRRTQRRVDALRREVGDEEFGVLLMEVKPRMDKIVEEVFHEEK
jgi:tetratricopeptide (TPR) repeat protein